jgi:lipopolysaccharide export system protein LptC
MTAAPASWLPLAVVAVMATVAYWLNHLASRPLPENDAAFRHDPELIVDNLVATAFDSAGNARYVLSAARMLHYTDDETTELTAPRFEHRSANAPMISAEAARGFISTHGEHVHLLDRVRLTRAATAATPELVLSTDYLQITPEAEVMRTDRPVELRQGASSIRADNLLLDGKARSLELKGNVKGIYEPR